MPSSASVAPGKRAKSPKSKSPKNKKGAAPPPAAAAAATSKKAKSKKSKNGKAANKPAAAAAAGARARAGAAEAKKQQQQANGQAKNGEEKQGLSPEHVRMAVAALFTHVAERRMKKKEKGKSSGGNVALFEDDSVISVTFGLRRTPDKPKDKPMRVALPHTLYGRDGREMCLFAKDPAEDTEKRLEESPVEGLVKVVGVSQLRKEYKQYEDRRQLMTAYDLFLADDRVVTTLPTLLGRKFFLKKKQPVAVRLASKSADAFRREIERARDSTYVFVPAGAVAAMRVGTTGFKAKEIVANILAAVPDAVRFLPGGWRNIQSIHVKTHDSVALPLFNQLPDHDVPKSAGEGAKAKNGEKDGAVKAMEVEEEEEDEDEEGEKKKKKKKTTTTQKGGKKKDKEAAVGAKRKSPEKNKPRPGKKEKNGDGQREEGMNKAEPAAKRRRTKSKTRK